jgi:GPN-loop GTPase
VTGRRGRTGTQDPAKFFAGTLTALSTMVQLEVPHINVFSKMDLYSRQRRAAIHRYLNADTSLLLAELDGALAPRYQALSRALAGLVRCTRCWCRPGGGLSRGSASRAHTQIDEYGMVSYLPLNIQSEQSVAMVLSHVDNAIQYGEDEEPKDRDVCVSAPPGSSVGDTA